MLWMIFFYCKSRSEPRELYTKITPKFVIIMIDRTGNSFTNMKEESTRNSHIVLPKLAQNIQA